MLLVEVLTIIAITIAVYLVIGLVTAMYMHYRAARLVAYGWSFYALEGHPPKEFARKDARFLKFSRSFGIEASDIRKIEVFLTIGGLWWVIWVFYTCYMVSMLIESAYARYSEWVVDTLKKQKNENRGD